jgi:hypothetical protein
VPLDGADSTDANTDTELSEDEHRDAIRNDAGNPAPVVPTPTKEPNQEKRSLGVAYDATLANRRQASQRLSY